MSIFQLGTVLIYVTSVLTSTVTDTSTPDRSPSSGLKKLFQSSQTETKDPTLLTDTRSVNDNGSTAVPSSEPKEQIFAEGGPVMSSIPRVETKSSVKPPDLADGPLLPDVKLTPTPKKISGIFPRKGVTFPEDLDQEKSTTTDQTLPVKSLPKVKETPTTEMPSLKITPIPKADESTASKNIPGDKKPEITGNRTNVTVLLVPGNTTNAKTHKRKPTYTTGEGDDDGKGMPSSPTKAEIGMPRKVDYIVPVVITIMATPVLGIAAFVLWTRGKDCWEKRHYRRMDFLIDGMYND